jgi:hypothetical protein
MLRRILSPLFLLAVSCAAGAVAVARQPSPCDLRPEGDPTRFTDIKPMPKWDGKGGVGIRPDQAQLKDTSAPVVVRGLLDVSSEKDRGGKLRCAELENRSTHTVKAVQLKWAVTTMEDENKVLASGKLPTVEVEIAPGGRMKVQLRDAQLADFLQPVADKGLLNGKFWLTVSVARVEYADGTAEDVGGQ